jgi:hypothetical protein
MIRLGYSRMFMSHEEQIERLKDRNSKISWRFNPSEPTRNPENGHIIKLGSGPAWEGMELPKYYDNNRPLLEKYRDPKSGTSAAMEDPESLTYSCVKRFKVTKKFKKEKVDFVHKKREAENRAFYQRFTTNIGKGPAPIEECKDYEMAEAVLTPKSGAGVKRMRKAPMSHSSKKKKTADRLSEESGRMSILGPMTQEEM